METALVNYIKKMFAMAMTPEWDSSKEGVIFYDQTAHKWVIGTNTGWEILDRSTTALSDIRDRRWIDPFEYPTDSIIRNNYISTSSGIVLCSEDNIKSYGDYALKGTAAISGTKDESFYKTVDPPIYLTDRNFVNFDVRSSRVGSNLQLEMSSLKNYSESWLSDWSDRYVITIDHTKIDEDLTHFPLMIPLKKQSFYTVKSIVIDIADCWESTSYIGIRSIDFYKENRKIVIDASFVTGYSTTNFNDSYLPTYTFITSLSKIGTFDPKQWLTSTSATTQQRLICVFDNTIEFDEIRINNSHHEGGLTTTGAKNVKINITEDTITDTVYNNTISNGFLLYDGIIDEHTTSDIEDEFIVPLTPLNEACTLTPDIFEKIGDNSKKIAITKNDGVTQLYCEIENWDILRNNNSTFTSYNLGTDDLSSHFSTSGNPVNNADYVTFDGESDGYYASNDLGNSATEVIFAKIRIHNKNKGTAQIIWKDGGYVNGVALGIDSSGNLGIFGVNGGNSSSLTISSSDYEDNVWYNIFVNHNNVILYDEFFNVITNKAGYIVFSDGAANESLGFCGEQSPITKATGTNIEYFEGDIALVEIFNTENYKTSDKKATLWVSKYDWTISSTEDTTLYLYYDSTKDDNTEYIGDSGASIEVTDVTEDTFTGDDGDLPNEDLWIISNNSVTGTCQISTNKLRLSIPNTSNNEGISIDSKFYLSGDFDTQVDFNEISNDAPSSSYSYPSRFSIHYDGGYIMMGTNLSSTNVHSLLAWENSGESPSETITDSMSSGKFRIKRVGSTYTGYVWDNDRWEWNGNTSGKVFSVSDTSYVYVRLSIIADFDSGVVTDFDNFIINSGTVKRIVSQNVWDSNFKAVYHMAQDPSGGTDCILDSTFNVNNGTPGGSMTSDDLVDADYGKAIDFDGTDDYISLGDMDAGLDGDFIWEFITKPNSINDTANHFFNKRNTSDLNKGLGFYHERRSGRDVEECFNAILDIGSTTTRIVTPDFSISNGTTYNVSIKRDGTLFSLWLDGSLTSSDNSTGNDTNVSNNNPLYISTNKDMTGFAKQTCLELRISDIARSDAWIKATYNSNTDNLLYFSAQTNKKITHDIHIQEANTWQGETFPITTISGYCSEIKFNILNDDLENTFYIDNMYADNRLDNRYWLDAIEYQTDVALTDMFTTISGAGSGISLYSESNLKTYGDYALKGIATLSGSAGNGFYRTFEPAISLDNKNYFNFDFRSSRVGTNMKTDLRYRDLSDAEWLSGWGNRYNITIDHTEIDENLTHFPLMLILDEEDYPDILNEFEVASKKIAITKADGCTQLYCEIESWNDVSEEDYLGSDERKTQCTASSYYTTFIAEKAFNGTVTDSNDTWISDNNGAEIDGSCWLQVNFGVDKSISKIRMFARNGGAQNQFPENIKILGSSTGTFSGEESTLCSGTCSQPTSEGEPCNWISISSPQEFQYIRIEIHTQQNVPGQSTASWVAVGEIEFTMIAIKQAVLWVSKYDWTISSTEDTTLYLYYDSTKDDNTEYIGDSGSTVAQNVWDSNFKAVYHMAQDPSGGTDCILDSTLNENHGTPAGTMTSDDLVDADYGKAIDFDGSNDLINCGNNTSLNVGNEMTVEIRINPTVVGLRDGFIAKRSPSESAGNWCFRCVPSEIEFKVWDPSSTTATSTSTISTDVWQFLGLTFDDTINTTKFYIDGDIDKTDSSSVTGNLTTNSDDLHIGDDGQDDHFSGKIADVRISNVVRSDAWIKATNASNTNTLTSGTLNIPEVSLVSKDIYIDDLNNYWTESVDLTTVSGSFNKLQFTILNDDLENTFYLDNMYLTSYKMFDIEQSVGVWLENWAYRIKITVDNTNIDNDLTHFPIPIVLSSETGQTNADVTDIFDELGTEFKKIAITKADKTTQLYGEIEQWDSSTEKAVIWTSASGVVLSATETTDFYLYYDSTKDDNTDYIGEASDAASLNVWDSNFEAVYNMAQDPSGGTDCILDSTINENNGTPGGSLTSSDDLVDGSIGKALQFNSSDDDSIDVSGGTLAITDAITVEGYAKLDAAGGGDYARLYHNGSGSSNRCVEFWTVSNGNVVFRINNSSSVSDNFSGFTLGDWYYFVGRYDSVGDETIRLQVDLTEIGTTSASASINSNSNVYIGNWSSGGSRGWNGRISMVRVSNVKRTDAWIKLNYYAQTNNLLTFNNIESYI